MLLQAWPICVFRVSLSNNTESFFYSICLTSQHSKLPGNGGKFPAGLSFTNRQFFGLSSVSTTIILWTKPLTSESSLFRYIYISIYIFSSIVKTTQIVG